MPRRTKDAPGRVTPKGTQPRRGGTGASARSQSETFASGRYTAPIPREYKSSPWWVPAIILTLFGLGLLAIVLNYLSLLPGAPTNVYLFVGLGLIVLGFVASTRYH